MKKSDPKIGLETDANTNLWRTTKPLRFKVRTLEPYVVIDEPLAATKVECGLVEEITVGGAGITETSAPVSIKNARPEMLSHTDRDSVCAVCMDLTCAAAACILEKLDVLLLEIVPGASASRRGRFPRPASG